MMRWLAAVGIAALLVIGAKRAQAQRALPEVRLDVIGPEPYSPQIGLGLNTAVGTYTRLTAAVGYGPREATDGTRNGELRGDLLARVTLDPFRQQRWALALGGGLSVRRQPYLALLVDVEAPGRNGWIPVLQLGVGGGARAGLILRRALLNRR